MFLFVAALVKLLKLQRLTIPHVGTCKAQLEFSCSSSGNKQMYNFFQNHSDNFSIVSHTPALWHNNLSSRILPTRNENPFSHKKCLYKDEHVSFIHNSQHWRQHKCLSVKINLYTQHVWMELKNLLNENNRTKINMWHCDL